MAMALALAWEAEEEEKARNHLSSSGLDGVTTTDGDDQPGKQVELAGSGICCCRCVLRVHHQHRWCALARFICVELTCMIVFMKIDGSILWLVGSRKAQWRTIID